MASYTIELRNVCELYGREEVENWFKSYNLEDYLTQEQINVINNRGVWNKDKLAKKIVNHYFMREIGLETPALFAHYAKITMEELMEEKLPLIYSNSIEYNPMINVDFTETFEREIEGIGKNTSESSGSSNSSSSNNGSGLNIGNDTPQTNINKQDILNGNYASTVNASETESNIEDETTTSSNIESNSNTNTTESYTRTQKGNSGSLTTAQKLIEQYRQNIIAIDRDIIKELSNLFMGLY